MKQPKAEMVDAKAAAAYCRIPYRVFMSQLNHGHGPAHMRLSHRHRFFDPADLDVWLASKMVKRTK